MTALTDLQDLLPQVHPAVLGKFLRWVSPSGRGATLMVAASNASDASKLSADYWCGDYATDDQAIQAAINALPAGGGKVVLSEGTFNTSSPILLIESNIALEGMGKATTIKPVAAFPTTNGIIQLGENITDLSGITLRNFTIDGNKAQVGANIYGIWGLGLSLSNLLVEDITLTDIETHGIYIGTAVLHSIFRNLLINSPGSAGVYAPGSAVVSSEDVLFEHISVITPGIGIWVYSGVKVTVRACYIDDPTTQGILVNGGDAAAQRDCLVADNWIRAASIGIAFVGQAGYNYPRPIVQGNHVSECSQEAIDLNNCSYGLVSGNVLWNNALSAVFLEADTDHCEVVGNLIFDDQGSPTQDYGVEETGTSDYNLVHSNYFFGHVIGGVLLLGANSVARGNLGHNPVGALGPPAVPASTVAYTNAYGVDCQVYLKGGTVTVIVVDGLTTGLTLAANEFVSVLVPASKDITITYTVAPTWTWYGL